MSESFGPNPAATLRYCYAHLSDDGTVLASSASPVFYPPAIAEALGATVITEEQYAVVSQPGQWAWNDGTPTLVPPPAPVLADVKAKAALDVDTSAEDARARFLTAGSGQAMEYDATAACARRAMAALEADPSTPLVGTDYPWLQAELEALAEAGTTVSLADVATQIAVTTAQWTAIGAEIKRLRRTAKLLIENCGTAEEVAAIVAGLVWPTPS